MQNQDNVFGLVREGLCFSTLCALATVGIISLCWLVKVTSNGETNLAFLGAKVAFVIWGLFLLYSLIDRFEKPN